MIEPQKLYISKRNMFVRQKCQTALFRMICVQLVEDAHCNGGYIEYSIFCYYLCRIGYWILFNYASLN